MLTLKQLDKLANMFLDIAKGTFLGAFVLPVITKGNYSLFIQGIIVSGCFTYFGLKLVRLSERSEL